MNKYIQNLNPTIQQYFKILSPEGIPDFLFPYIETKEMQRIGKISMNCGTDYTYIFNNKFFYSNLEHSIGVALIVWHFTKNKKQTLAGLFHDIATPVFKHCIDFMNGDHEKQESTEELTTDIIKNSKEIMDLLQKDNIKLEEVEDYKIYPIADNDTPKMSADRFEYNFSGGIVFKPVWKNLEDIKDIYNDITILKNEEGIIELGFKHIEKAEKYISTVSKLWTAWITNQDKITMQFIADTVKKLYEAGEISKKDLYTLSEAEVINRIETTTIPKVAECFKKFRNSTQVGESDKEIKGKYCISIKAKRRYIVPLVKTESGTKRINEISEVAKKDIQDYLNWNTKKYAYLDFDF